jgi:hypothetical protein
MGWREGLLGFEDRVKDQDGSRLGLAKLTHQRLGMRSNLIAEVKKPSPLSQLLQSIFVSPKDSAITLPLLSPLAILTVSIEMSGTAAVLGGAAMWMVSHGA